MFPHTEHVVTLANSIIGVGILAMPFCFQKCGIILAILLLVLSNWITRICCHYLIKASLLTRRRSFEFLGFHAFGASGKLLAELCIIGYLLGTCITYFVVVGDLGPQIITKIFAINPEHRHLRTVIMIAVTILCILPLGMLRNVDSLSTLCMASIGFYICLVMKIILESEQHIVTQDWTEKVIYWEPAGVLQCLPIFSMALSCQMQIFEVFSTINNQSLEKLNGIVRNATWICTVVYIAVGFFGYVAFCTQTFSGNILINLSPSFGSDIIKIGFVLSIAFSFPLVIFPCRASIYSLLYRKSLMDSSSYIPEGRFRTITLFIIILSLSFALMIPSVELIIGLVGSTIGIAICIMFPASSFRKIVKKDSTERMLAQFIFISGFCLMILGTFANLNAIDEHSSGTHMEVVPIEESLKLPPTILVQKSNVKDKLEEREVAEKQQIIKEESVKANLKALTEPFPPLPIDEFHKVIKSENIEKSDMLLKIKAADTIAKENDDHALKNRPTESAPILESATGAPIKVKYNSELKMPPSAFADVVIQEQPPNKVQNNNDPVPAQETIDLAALKKEDEIVEEEQKKHKDNDEELRKTQNELKKTKELLERTVDELKVELAKQNQETQELVEVKLNEVVEKVAQIERKVQTKEDTRNAPEPAAENPDNKLESKPILNVMADGIQPHEEHDKRPRVYEPLSYKTGELYKNESNKKLEPLLPLPLALLHNTTQIKSDANKIPTNSTKNLEKHENIVALEEETIKQIKKDANEQIAIKALPQQEGAVRNKRDSGLENCTKKTANETELSSPQTKEEHKIVDEV